MEFITREITSTYWITIVIVVCMVLLAMAKLFNAVQFSNFIMLFNTNKYMVLNQKANKLSTIFNAILLVTQIISVSLFIYICFTVFDSNIQSKEAILYFQVAVLYMFTIICKILIEKIVATLFSIDAILDDYLFYKLSYRNFLGILLLPFNIIFIYTVRPTKITLIIILAAILIFNIIVLFSMYWKHQKIILNHLFYFILYLCALEIAPYFILYKLIK